MDSNWVMINYYNIKISHNKKKWHKWFVNEVKNYSKHSKGKTHTHTSRIKP